MFSKIIFFVDLVSVQYQRAMTIMVLVLGCLGDDVRCCVEDNAFDYYSEDIVFLKE